MEEYNSQAFVPNISFYRHAAFSMLNPGADQSSAPDLSRLSMSPNQLAYARSFVDSTLRRPITPSELMLIDGYCRTVSKTTNTIALNELTLNDEYIASAYASLMSERHRMFPESETHPRIDELLEIIADISTEKTKSKFPFSELDAFSASDDERARLECLAGGCKPTTMLNGVCIGKKITVPKNDSSSATAVIYAAIGQRPADLELFLASSQLLSSKATVEFCPTMDIFARLIWRYDEFLIDTLSLPNPKSTEYGNQPNYAEEIFTAEICDAFFTDSLFGDYAILVHGNRSTVRSLCNTAARLNLSSFGGIYTPKRAKRSNKKSLPQHVIRINCLLYRFLSELCDNLNVTIPDHVIHEALAANDIPRSEITMNDGYDAFCSANASISSSALPFHSAFYSVISPTAHLLSLRDRATTGQLSLSLSVMLCFDDEKSAGASIAALLGIYTAARLSLPITNLHFSLTDHESMRIKATAHDFAPHASSSPEHEELIRRSIAQNAEENPNKIINNLDFLSQNP